MKPAYGEAAAKLKEEQVRGVLKPEIICFACALSVKPFGVMKVEIICPWQRELTVS